jgi:DNA-binding transcriptional ArsR family regulator
VADRPAVAIVSDPEKARHLLDPLRVRILELARDPASASDLAGRMDLGRQRLNYHVKQLVAAGLLEPAGSRVRRGLEERFYRASALSYVIAPQATGAMAPPESAAGDLVALSSLVLADLAWFQQHPDGRRSPGAVQAMVRLGTAAQRKAFLQALQEAVDRLAETHGSKGAGAGLAYRVVVAASPKPE